MCGNSHVPSLSIKHLCKLVVFLTLVKQDTTTSEDLRMSSNFLHCIFTPEANLNPSVAHNAVLRPFILAQ